MRTRESINSYERCISVLEGRKPDVSPVVPMVTEWCSRQAGIEFIEELESVEKHVYSQSYCVSQFDYDIVRGLTGCSYESEAMGSVLNICKGYLPSIEKPAVEEYKRDLPKLKLFDPYANKHLSIILEGLRRLRSRFHGEVAVMAGLQAPFLHATKLRGYENTMRDMYKQREHLRELCEIALHSLIVFAVALSSTGADIIFIADPASSGSVISKKQWEDWGLPLTTRLIKLIKRSGVKTIMHVCGQTEDRLESLASTGVDCLSLDEIVDFEKARKILGPNYCLMGNVSTTLLAMGSPEEVAEATKELIQKAGKNGHLLVSGGCTIPENCPPDNMRAMVKAARKHRL